MKIDLKGYLLSLADSDEVKGMICDLLDNYVHNSDNEIDDRMARGVRAALFPHQALRAD